jgi:hypothetical protein
MNGAGDSARRSAGVAAAGRFGPHAVSASPAAPSPVLIIQSRRVTGARMHI